MAKQETPHRRYNPLTGEWVLVSPHRSQRPWQGGEEKKAVESLPAHDPGCYLCPGNTRKSGVQNPNYDGVFVFTNDYQALLPDAREQYAQKDPLFRRQNVRGACKVLCFSPRHDLTLPQLPLEDIRRVVDAWAGLTEELGQTFAWVQVFENKGEAMGCSSPHPHCQIWAQDSLPTEILKEDACQLDYMKQHDSVLLADYLERELELGERVVLENEHWAAVVPYWAVWPFETLLMPKARIERLYDLSPGQRNGLAAAVKTLTAKYDQLFATSFPYSMGWHGAPFTGGSHDHWRLHAHYYPPLLRSATVRKFMVGYEMLGEPQRDLTPEIAAQTLRELPGDLTG